MTPERWREIEAVFAAALELDGGARAGFLGERCSGDPELLREVSALLESAGSAGDYFKSLADRLGVPTGPEVRSERLVGKRVGNYRVVRLIARGGMGAVYLAERDDAQFQMRAALKLLPVGLGSEDAFRRFLAERQILARLEHPKIARLLDGGVTDDGTPYFLMEYVEGTSITDFCDARKLSVDHRLELFLEVCEAVQHAHQNLIVHRDIKPGNIFVSESGAVKLLDFGIARALDPEGSDALKTLTHRARPMTPAYASPEQMRGESVTTASDVYSLGVLLYRLLCGRHPYPISGKTPGEVERIVCEEDPPPPSEALLRRNEDYRRGEGEEVGDPAELARARGVSVERLRRQLAGDLDNIVRAAMRKDPARRYASAIHLADDIRRHRGGYPVRAHKDSLGYRASRFVRRYKGRVAAAAVVLVLAAGLVFMSVRYAVTTGRQSQAIALEAATADQVSSFLIDLFEIADPAQEIGDTVTARTILDRGRERIEISLQDHPEVRARMMFVLGRVYDKLGLYDDAVELFTAALEIRRGLYGSVHRDVAESLEYLAAAHTSNRDFESAAPLYAEAVEVRRRLGTDSAALAMDLAGLARTLRDLGKVDSALVLMREASTIRRQLFAENDLQAIRALHDLAYVLRAQGELDSAEVLYRKVIPGLREHADSGARFLGAALNNLAFLLMTKGEYAEAEQFYREAVATERRWGAPPRVAMALNNLASVLAYQERDEEAEATFREAVAVREEHWGPRHRRVGQSYYVLGTFLLTRGDTLAAEENYRKAVAIYAEALGADDGRTARAKAALATTLLAERRYDEAERLLLEAYPILRDDPSAEAYARDALTRIVEVYEAWGKPEKAEEYRGLLSGTTE